MGFNSEKTPINQTMEKDWRQNRDKSGSGRLQFICQEEERKEQTYIYKKPDPPPTRRRPPWPPATGEREVGRGDLERKAQERKDHTGLFSTGVSGSPRVYCAIPESKCGYWLIGLAGAT
jgi:hypothetical protein